MQKLKAYEFSDTQLFADEIPIWASGCPFGHLGQKYSFILTKLNMLNETIQEIFDLDSQIRDNKRKREYTDSELSLRPVILKMRFCSELKICTDDIIALNSLLHSHLTQSKWPNEIKIDSISTLIKKDFPSGFEELKDTKDTLAKLNGLGNAIKHSFINTESLWYRTYEPSSIIIGFYQHYNKKSNKIKTFEVDLLSYIDDYNIFLGIMKSILKNNYRQHR